MTKKRTAEYFAVKPIGEEAGMNMFDLMAKSKEMYEKYIGPYKPFDNVEGRVEQITKFAAAIARGHQTPLNPGEVAMTKIELNNGELFGEKIQKDAKNAFVVK